MAPPKPPCKRGASAPSPDTSAVRTSGDARRSSRRPAASFAKGSANAEGQVLGGFELETYSDPDFSIEQSSGFRTGDVMYFDVTIDKKISNLEFVGKFQLFYMTHSVYYFYSRNFLLYVDP